MSGPRDVCSCTIHQWSKGSSYIWVLFKGYYKSSVYPVLWSVLLCTAHRVQCTIFSVRSVLPPYIFALKDKSVCSPTLAYVCTKRQERMSANPNICQIG
jgi:hypothetical protein